MASQHWIFYHKSKETAKTARSLSYLDVLQQSVLMMKGKKKKKKTKIPSKSHANNDNLARQDAYDWQRKKRNTLMVVASLIATMAFQVGANPPGGFWQDNFEGDAKTPAHKAGVFNSG